MILGKISSPDMGIPGQSSEEDELSLWMSTMKDNKVTQFQQQMYTGFSKMLIEMGKLYHE